MVSLKMAIHCSTEGQMLIPEYLPILFSERSMHAVHLRVGHSPEWKHTSWNIQIHENGIFPSFLTRALFISLLRENIFIKAGYVSEEY